MAGQPPRANLWSPSLRGTGAHFSMSSGYRTQTLILVQWALHRLSHLPRPVFPFTDIITILFMRIIACTWKYDCRINFLNADTVIKNVYLQSSLQAMSKFIPTTYLEWAFLSLTLINVNIFHLIQWNSFWFYPLTNVILAEVETDNLALFNIKKHRF